MRHWHQKRASTREEKEMDLNTKTVKLNRAVMVLALALASVAAQSPLF